MKLKRKLRKQKENQEIVSKAIDYKKFSTEKNEKKKVLDFSNFRFKIFQSNIPNF